MKFLVVSDSHGNREILETLVARHQNEVEAFFHCGDSELAPTDPIWQHYQVVNGNCDGFNYFPNEVTVELGQERIFMTHGHLVNVNSTLDVLVDAAAAQAATICLFGHTHQLGVERRQGILVLNPGSILLPRGRYFERTYALVESTDDCLTVQYRTDEGTILTELERRFPKEA